MNAHDSSQPIVQQRLAALQRYQIMDTVEEPAYDELVRRACEICETPISAVTLLDDRRQWFKARVGFPERETPIEDAFCARAIEHRDEVMIVPDTSRDARFWSNRFVTGDFKIRSYAGAPLVTPEGVPIGTICVIDRKPHRFSHAETQALRSLARETVAIMEAARHRAALEAERARAEKFREGETHFHRVTETARGLITDFAAAYPARAQDGPTAALLKKLTALLNSRPD